MGQLERYEWCELWWEETAKNDRSRVLLIGDSIAKGYHSYLQDLLRDTAYVDRLATSKALDNPALIREIDHMIAHVLPSYYDVIHINNGLHGWHLTNLDYEMYYEQLVRHLQHHSNAMIILALTTPVTAVGKASQLDGAVNDRVIERNAVVERLAFRLQLKINDLYTPMLNHSEYRVDDGYHYNETGMWAQAKQVAARIGVVLG